MMYQKHALENYSITSYALKGDFILATVAPPVR